MYSEEYSLTSTLLLLIIATGSTVAQIHGQAPTQSPEVQCYLCDDSHTHRFPLCLQNPITCASGEACRILYSEGTNHHSPHFYSRCKSASHCAAEIKNHVTSCPSGGVKVHHGDVCEDCCTTPACVANVTDVLRLEVMASHNLFCPGRCDTDKLNECIDTGSICARGDFCQIKIDHGHRVTGLCKDDHAFHTCTHELHRTPCPENITELTAYDATTVNHCYLNCCTTNECLFSRFAIHMANASMSTDLNQLITSSNSNSSGSSNSSSSGNSLWEQLRGSCRDQFDKAMCDSLENDHDVCHSRLSLSMCPDTCGICTAVNSSVCEDTTVECLDLLQSYPDFCESGPDALFTCPRSCNRCDQLIDSIVTSIIAEDPTGIPLASSTTPAVAPTTATTPPAVNCHDLDTADCTHLAPLCDSTFLMVVCPDQCDRCLELDAPH